MSRKILFFLVALCAVSASLKSQNLQLHFDPRSSLYGESSGSQIDYLTATFEMYKPDKWGNTFMFVDVDFNFDKRNPGLVYTEIAREFKIGDFPLLPHIEYNGGLGLARGSVDPASGKYLPNGFSIPSSYMGGFGYPFRLGSFFMNSYLVYKLNAFDQLSHDTQLTFTWNATFAQGKVSLVGFLDLWTEDKSFTAGPEADGKKLIFLSEPQIWYNITPNFALGSEVELSYNFVNKFNESKFFAIPTLATKWTF